MKTIRIALPILLAAAAACPAQTNTADHFMGLGATLFDTLSVAGGQVGPSNSLAFGQATAAGQYSIALGYGAYAQHDRAFVWAGSSETGMASTTPGQFVVYAPGGIHLLGGTIHGNGSTLAGINASNLVGLGSAALKPYSYFAPAAAGTTANNALELAVSANGTATSAYNTAASALQSDGRVAWTGTQNAAGQSLTNLAGASAFSIMQGMTPCTSTVAILAGLHVSDGHPEVPSGDYLGDPTNGFYGANGCFTPPTDPMTDPYWHFTWSFCEMDFIGSIGCGSFYCGTYGSMGYWVASYDEYGNPTCLAISSGLPIDGYYWGDLDTGFGPFIKDGSGQWYFAHGVARSMDLAYGAEYPEGLFGYGANYFDITTIYTNIDTTWQEPCTVTNSVPFEVADGRHAWTGTHDAGGQLLRNLQDAYTYAITQETTLMTENRMTGLLVSDLYESGFPHAGVYSGDATNGFNGPASIARDEEWNWSIHWPTTWSEFIGALDLSSNSCFSVQGTTVDYTIGYDGAGSPDRVEIWCSGPFDGTYPGNPGTSFVRGDGLYSLSTDGAGNWWFNCMTPDESVGLGAFGEGGYPTGNFSGGAAGWSFSISPHNQDVTWQETHPVTNAVAFEAADGRHAWVGDHNAGGFDLGNVGTLQAQVVVGDGSGLFNVGLAALNVASVDLRYLLKAGDTVTGDLEVNGALTVGGRPVATLDHIPPQGGISMGSFTNVTVQP